MVMRVTGTDSARWGSHIASVHLHRDWQKLAADVAAGADHRVIAADKAAIVESRRDMAVRGGARLVDVTV
jgi:hypothetical protein